MQPTVQLLNVWCFFFQNIPLCKKGIFSIRQKKNTLPKESWSHQCWLLLPKTAESSRRRLHGVSLCLWCRAVSWGALCVQLPEASQVISLSTVGQIAMQMKTCDHLTEEVSVFFSVHIQLFKVLLQKVWTKLMNVWTGLIKKKKLEWHTRIEEEDLKLKLLIFFSLGPIPLSNHPHFYTFKCQRRPLPIIF